MTTIEEQKTKLEQKKARMILEEARLKIKERKMRTRSLIEKGGLITKAGLDHLPSNALYGALISIKKDLDDNENLLSGWIVKGNTAFNAEQKDTTPVILKFPEEPNSDIRAFVRSHGLRFNSFRQEWYGNALRLEELKSSLGEIQYNLEEIEG
jgi:hypothetical protein